MLKFVVLLAVLSCALSAPARVKRQQGQMHMQSAMQQRGKSHWLAVWVMNLF